MNIYDKLEHAERVWSVAETAAFLGYSRQHLYKLIREHKIEGWIQSEGGHYKFCPQKLKAWMDKRFNSNGKSKGGGNVQNKPVKEDNDAA